MNYYIHVPFCRSKCGYCAFYSEAAPVPGAVDAYLDRLEFQFDRLEPSTSAAARRRCFRRCSLNGFFP